MTSRGYENCIRIMLRLEEAGVGPVIHRDALRKWIAEATQIVHPPAVGGLINALVDVCFLEKIDAETYRIVKYRQR